MKGFQYLQVSTDLFNTQMAEIMLGTLRPICIGGSWGTAPYQFDVRCSRLYPSAFEATIVLADDTQFTTGWNRSSINGNSLVLVQADSLIELAASMETVVAGLTGNITISNYLQVPHEEVRMSNHIPKSRYFQLVSQD